MHPLPPSTDYLARQQTRVEGLRTALTKIAECTDRLTLEIGSGHGHYLTGYSAANPTRVCVGIDVMLDRHARSERKRTRAQLSNLFFLRAAAEDFLAALPESLWLEDVLVLFPDPWPKRRHHKNRLIQPGFLDILASKALPGARLCFRTDHEEYFAFAREHVGAHPNWIIDPGAPWPFELATVFQTRAHAYQSFIAHRRRGQE